MKIIFPFFCCLISFGCVYDPPITGKELIFNNQSKIEIFVTDKNISEGIGPMYDTMLVNNRVFISKKPYFMEKYTQWEDFLSEDFLKSMVKKNIDSISFNFIEILDETKADVQKGKTTFIKINVKEILENDINRVIYTSDSIRLYHKFDMKHISKQQASNRLREK